MTLEPRSLWTPGPHRLCGGAEGSKGPAARPQGASSAPTGAGGSLRRLLFLCPWVHCCRVRGAESPGQPVSPPSEDHAQPGAAPLQRRGGAGCPSRGPAPILGLRGALSVASLHSPLSGPPRNCWACHLPGPGFSGLFPLPPASTLPYPRGSSLRSVGVIPGSGAGGTLPLPPEPEVPQPSDPSGPQPLLLPRLPVPGSRQGPPRRPRRRGWRDSCPDRFPGPCSPNTEGARSGLPGLCPMLPGTGCTFSVPRKMTAAIVTMTGGAHPAPCCTRPRSSHQKVTGSPELTPGGCPRGSSQGLRTTAASPAAASRLQGRRPCFPLRFSLVPGAPHPGGGGRSAGESFQGALRWPCLSLTHTAGPRSLGSCCVWCSALSCPRGTFPSPAGAGRLAGPGGGGQGWPRQRRGISPGHVYNGNRQGEEGGPSQGPESLP